ncbi:TetR family transcriptional regulator [Amnibacterium setariae]|uniref:TetR family transcriptional regulator n=1 Tax=Amnibacterium setariae TaxID=2306585 RepID=A0A3A1U1M9_9MICO|nr:TetR family transcriptional regulator [Amnibacterium setariae]RIX26527.1 TetR family transcriptional regulator [Amnibacterium setariae]
MTDTAAPGLREQKRIATKRALQLALLQLALERGFDNVTVEEVAQAAQVSTRTFFNYFASKEEALTAPHGPVELSEDEVARYQEGAADPLTDLVVLMAGRASGKEDFELHRLRRDLMHRESRLFGDKATLMQQFREQIVAIVAERLRADELREGRMPDEVALQERAAFTALLCLTIARHGWSRWAAGEGATTLSECMLGALDEFREIAAATTR